MKFYISLSKIPLTLLIISLVISACGRKGDPEPLEKSDYPRTYPKPT